MKKINNIKDVGEDEALKKLYEMFQYRKPAPYDILVGKDGMDAFNKVLKERVIAEQKSAGTKSPTE